MHSLQPPHVQAGSIGYKFSTILEWKQDTLKPLNLNHESKLYAVPSGGSAEVASTPGGGGSSAAP